MSSVIGKAFGLRGYGRLFGIHLGLVTLGSAVAPLAIFTPPISVSLVASRSAST